MKIKFLTRGAITLACAVFLFSCAKTPVAPEIKPDEEEASVPGSPRDKDPTGRSNAKYESDMSLSEMEELPDGSWIGNLGGVRCKFNGFIYEVYYDPNGNQLPPRKNEPAYPGGMGPAYPSDAGQFACLNIKATPGIPSNQFVVENGCVFYGKVYTPGAGFNAYQTLMLNNYYAFTDAYSQYQLGLGPLPKMPPAPFIMPYITQDMVSGSGGMISSARFGIYSYNASTGKVTYGIDSR